MLKASVVPPNYASRRILSTSNSQLLDRSRRGAKNGEIVWLEVRNSIVVEINEEGPRVIHPHMGGCVDNLCFGRCCHERRTTRGKGVR